MKILGIRIDEVDMVQVLCCIQEYINLGKPHHIITLNAEILYNARNDLALKEILSNASLVTPDGSGILWAANKLGQPLPERVTGIDLMKEICHQAYCNNWRLYLLGGAPQVAEEAIAGMKEAFPGIPVVGCHDGYFDEEEEKKIVEEINVLHPDVVFVALGAPKQEFWISNHLQELNTSVLIGVGGSFDVMAGRVKRAPVFMQKLQLEWLWRLILQPWRCKRMLVLPKFMLAVEKSRRQRKKLRDEMENRRGQLP